MRSASYLSNNISRRTCCWCEAKKTKGSSESSWSADLTRPQKRTECIHVTCQASTAREAFKIGGSTIRPLQLDSLPRAFILIEPPYSEIFLAHPCRLTCQIMSLVVFIFDRGSLLVQWRSTWYAGTVTRIPACGAALPLLTDRGMDAGSYPCTVTATLAGGSGC